MPYQPADALTVQTAQAVLDAGLRAIAQGQQQIDLSRLTAVDSAAVATLLAWLRAARRLGRPLVFSQFPPNLQSLIDLYGVTELLYAAPAAAPRADLPHH